MNPYQPQPYPRQGGGGGCWKAVGITCGIGCLLLVIGGVAFFVYVVPKVKQVVRPMTRSLQDFATVNAQMQRVWMAVDEYHKKKGRYPDNLAQLVPNYLPGKDSYRFPSGPTGKEFTYHKPAKGASPTSTMLEFNELKMAVPGSPPVPMPVRVLVNGESPENGSYGPPGSAGRASPGSSAGASAGGE